MGAGGAAKLCAGGARVIGFGIAMGAAVCGDARARSGLVIEHDPACRPCRVVTCTPRTEKRGQRGRKGASHLVCESAFTPRRECTRA